MRRCHDIHCNLQLGGFLKPGMENVSININHLLAADILDEYANSSPACLKPALVISIAVVFKSRSHQGQASGSLSFEQDIS
jgi:hypothetical protein